MANLPERAAIRLDGRRKTHASSPVVYHRGDLSVELLAAVGRTEFQTDDGSGVLETWQSRDFLISAADLVLDGQQVLPTPGDKVKETVGEATFTYEVMAPADRNQCYRLDESRVTLRVHTRQVAVEGA